MNTSYTRPIISGILFCCLLLLLQLTASAQETDTTKIELEQDQESDRMINLNQQFDRSVSEGIMTEMGTYQMPSEQQYYQHPFKGQEYLDMAVKAYREEMNKRAGGNWYWQFLKAVSPYIQLELGAFQTMQLQYVDRTNPLFQSYKDNQKEK